MICHWIKWIEPDSFWDRWYIYMIESERKRNRIAYIDSKKNKQQQRRYRMGYCVFGVIDGRWNPFQIYNKLYAWVAFWFRFRCDYIGGRQCRCCLSVFVFYYLLLFWSRTLTIVKIFWIILWHKKRSTQQKRVKRPRQPN